MSSKKRSISRKINLDLDHPISEFNAISSPSGSDLIEKGIHDDYFGELVHHSGFTSDDGNFSTSSSSSTIALNDSINDGDIDSVTWSKSSGSSTSDSDDLEAETTKKVAQEYDQIENILYEEEKNVPNDNQNEYEQWKENFAHLRIVGKAMKIHPSDSEDIEESYYEEVIAEHYDTEPELLNANETKIKSKIKETVINNVLKEVHTKILNKHQENNYSFSTLAAETPQKLRVSRNSLLSKVDPNITRSYNETFLQITSVPLHSSPFHYTRYNYQSPIMRSHLSASRWQREYSFSECASLPQVMQTNVPYSNVATNKRHLLEDSFKYSDMNSHSATSKTSVTVSTKSTSTLPTKTLTLPPIQNLKLHVTGDNKSGSATVRNLNSVTPVKCFRQKY